MRELLEDVAKLNKLDYKEYLRSNEGDCFWDGNITFSGIKRVIYSLWHEGENEKGDDITFDYVGKSVKLYQEMVEKYSKEKMPVLFIEGTKYE